MTIGIVYMITDRHTRWHNLNLNILLLSTEKLRQLYIPVWNKPTKHNTSCVNCLQRTWKNVTRRSPVFSCWEQSCWSLLRWKFSFYCMYISAEPLSRSSSIVKRNRDFREFSWRWNIFQQSKRSTVMLPLCAVTFWYWQTMLAFSSTCQPWTCKTIESIHHLLLFVLVSSPKVDKIYFYMQHNPTAPRI